MTSTFITPDRLARLAHWALTLEQRQRFAGMVARRNATRRRLADIYAQAEVLAEAMTLRAMPAAGRRFARAGGWTPTHERFFQATTESMIGFRRREIEALLHTSLSDETSLQAYAEFHRFRSADELAAGLGLSLADSLPSSANEP